MLPPSTDPEAQLVSAATRGDSDAFSRLVQLHQRHVFKLAGRFFRRREDVEEAAQETFLTAWRKLDTYRAEAPFGHWLTRVCLNCCYGKLRKEKPSQEPLELEHEPTAPVRDPSLTLDVARVLAPLSPRDRFILLLLYGEGWSTAEIAEKLGWTAVNVKVRAHRARKKLRARLERES